MDFFEHLKNSLPIEEITKLKEALDKKEAHAVLLNPNKISDEEFLKEFPHVQKHPYVNHAYLYDKDEYPLGKHLYHELGYYYLQEPSAMIVSSLIDFKKNDVVLDLCAAPGGKSIQASLKMNGKGLIISNDISTSRANQRYLNTFDKIILDAPCSGSGMFRKDELMKEDWSINKVYKFSEIQKELITYAYLMLKPGGLLSYSTCSYSKEEDEDVINHLLQNSDAQIEDINLKDGYKTIGVRLMPSHFNGEGQYICHIRKPGISQNTKFKNNSKYSKNLVNSYQEFDSQKFGDSLFAISNIIDVQKLKIIRYGVKVGEEHKGVFKYDLHYARSLNKNDDFPSIELNDNEVKQYLEGNQLHLPNKNKGYVLLTCQNNSIDIAKTDGNVIKNHYPKGLRRKF